MRAALERQFRLKCRRELLFSVVFIWIYVSYNDQLFQHTHTHANGCVPCVYVCVRDRNIIFDTFVLSLKHAGTPVVVVVVVA